MPNSTPLHRKQRGQGASKIKVNSIQPNPVIENTDQIKINPVPSFLFLYDNAKSFHWK